MHEVSRLGWDCSSSRKQVVTTLKVDDMHPTCVITRNFYASASFFVYPFATTGGVIQSAAFFSNVSQNERKITYIYHIFIFHCFLCVRLHYVSLAIYYQFIRKK